MVSMQLSPESFEERCEAMDGEYVERRNRTHECIVEEEDHRSRLRVGFTVNGGGNTAKTVSEVKNNDSWGTISKGSIKQPNDLTSSKNRLTVFNEDGDTASIEQVEKQ